jgi:hypothetical protein
MGALCTLLVGASVVVPIVVSTTSVSAATATQDKIIYVQKTGQPNTGPYVEYEGANGTNVTQSLSLAGGSCSSSTVSNPASALLPLTAAYYGSAQPPYSGKATATSVGSAVTSRVAETGVCVNSRTSPGYTLQPNEGLIFTVGTNSLTAGRVFSQATIPLKRNDNNRGSLSGNLILRRTNATGVQQTVDTVPFTLPALGTESAGDASDCPVISTGVVPAGDQFDQLELQVDTPSTGSVSVVGPSCDADNDADDQAVPTFYLDSAPTITSANNATFTAGTNTGTNSSFTVSATGYPTPTLSDASTSSCTTTLPTGVSFTPNTNGTATIAGTPATTTKPGGTYTFNVCIAASNSASTATQAFTLTVDQTPAIASANNTTFTAGDPGTFTVSTTGYPTPTLSDAGFNGCTTSLPGNVNFTPNSNGTATIAGTPSAITSGSYSFSLCISASNGSGTTATQTFTLTVDQAPAITSDSGVTLTSGSSALFTSGTYGSFKVTTTGYPPPALTNAAFGAGTCTPSTLPSGVSFLDNGDGTATISGTPTNDSGGTYIVCINATNSVSSATQTFTLTVDQASAITSPDTATVPSGTGFGVSVSTTGYPYPAFSVDPSPPAGCASSLPGDLTLTATAPANGTATLASVNGLAEGTYCFKIDASNSLGTTATQVFTLTSTQPPAITSLDNVIVPAGSPFSFEVTTTGYPFPALNDSGFSGCTTALPDDSSVSFTDLGNGTAAIAGTPAAGDGGTYPVCINASNGLGTATQSFSLVVTSSTTPLQAVVTAPASDPVSASIALDSGSKSFEGFGATGTPGGTTTVTFTTPSGDTSTFTATLNVDWGDLTYCVPYASTSPATCEPTEVTIGPAGSPATVVLPCGPTNTPSASAPGWCSEDDSYSYPIVNGTEYTNIVQTLFGAGDVTFSHA